MQYREKTEVTKSYKKNYVRGLEQLIKNRQKSAEAIRREYTKNIFTQQEQYRNDLKEMLGWPLVDYEVSSPPQAEEELLSEEDGYAIYRMQFEILEGLKMTGLLFKEKSTDKKPLVLVQHGGWGTPERISGMYDDTVNYNDMLMRVRKNNVHVFAPQLLLWHDNYQVEFNRENIDARLKRVGSSITAVEIFGLMQILNFFEKQDYVSSFGMVGLSYGGFYTLFTAALDVRIQAAISCSFFNTRDQVGWSDWTWFRSAEKFDDAEVACLIYPRKLHIAFGNRDELFDCDYSIKAFEKLKELCKPVGTDWVEFKVFDGIHEFFLNDEPIKQLVDYIKAVPLP